jgi:hypothetical protein
MAAGNVTPTKERPMSRLARFALAAFAAATAATAQETPAPTPSPRAEQPAPPRSPEQLAKEADIKRLMETMGSRKMAEQVLDQMMAILRQSTPAVPAAVWDELRGSFATGELEQLQLRIWDEHFTHDDVKGLIQFYDSPLGRKLIEQQPHILKESMEAGQAWGMRALERMKQKLRDKGYTVA